MRIREMGFAKVDGAFTYVSGQYVTPFSFDASALTDNQSFTISSADLFKAYCLNKDFRKAIDTGKYLTTVQTVLGLCYGLQLSVPEAEMLVGKTDFNIKPTNP